VSDVQDRPRDATELVQFKLRIREDLRGKIESAAAANATSMNSEIAARLDRSLADDTWYGTGPTRALLVEIAGQIARAEAYTGLPWHEDAATFFASRRLIEDVLKRARPRPENYDEVNKLHAEKLRLEGLRDHLGAELPKWGAVARNQNALLGLAGTDFSLGFYELPEDKWHSPDSPDWPLDDDLKPRVRQFVLDLMGAQERIAVLAEKIRELQEPWRKAQDRGNAMYEHLTRPDDIVPMKDD
jgi:hypothetical protein